MRRHQQFEGHGEASFTAQAAFGFADLVPDGGEGALDGIGGSGVFPVLCWEVKKGERRLATLDELGHRFVVLHALGLHEEVKCGICLGHRLSLPYVN